jgi:TrmH family RNA methyltransferase
MSAGMNMNFDDLKKLRHKKYRDELGFFFAEGEHLALELGKALAHRPQLAAAKVLVSEEYFAAGLPSGFPRQLAIETLGARQMSQLSETRSPQGVIAVVPRLTPPAPQDGERAIYLHQIQDPGNLGTILRTLGWFAGFRCLLSPDSVEPYNPKVVRASMGAIFNVPFETDVTLETVQARYPRIALLDIYGSSVAENSFKHFDCYMFGSESRGATAQMRATCSSSMFSIPGGRGVESLNLASTVNICAYELSKALVRS